MREVNLTEDLVIKMTQPEEVYLEMHRVFSDHALHLMEAHCSEEHSSMTPDEIQQRIREKFEHFSQTAQVQFRWDNKGLLGQTQLVPLATWKTDDGVVYSIRINHQERRWRFHVLGPITKLKEPIPDAIWNAWEHFSDATVWNPTQLVALIKQATERNMWSRRAHTYALLALQAYRFPESQLELSPDWELVEQFAVHGGNLFTVCYSPARDEAALLIKGTDNWRNVATDFWFGLTSLFGRRYSAGVLDPCACGCARFPGLHEAMEIGKALQNARLGIDIETSATISQYFVDKLRKLKINHITIVGHSLGGLMTEMVAIKLGLRGESFDSPGCRGSCIMSEKEYQRALAEGRVRVNNYFSTPHVINTVNNHPGVMYQLMIPETFKVADGRKLRPRTLPLARLRRRLRYLLYGIQWTLSRHRMAAYEEYLKGLPAERTEPTKWPTLTINNAWVIITGRGERERSPFENNPDTTENNALTRSAIVKAASATKTADHNFLEWLLKRVKLEYAFPGASPASTSASSSERRKDGFRAEIVKGFVNYLMLRHAGELSGEEQDSVAVTIDRFRDHLIRELMGTLQESHPILGESSRCKERTYRLEMLMALRELLLEAEGVLPMLIHMERITSIEIPTLGGEQTPATDVSTAPSFDVPLSVSNPTLLERSTWVQVYRVPFTTPHKGHRSPDEGIDKELLVRGWSNAKLKEPIPGPIWNAWEHFSDAPSGTPPNWSPHQAGHRTKHVVTRAHKYALLALQAYCSSASKLEFHGIGSWWSTGITGGRALTPRLSWEFHHVGEGDTKELLKEGRVRVNNYFSPHAYQHGQTTILDVNSVADTRDL
ncbi:hypothetical protein BV898_03159 [Hypsibius exemplaris]|uniref:Fungal lipase-like domain-containing protein n=1 Tax=Hypsibius exemplaris TaxID=2072580 RepID=A0A1W0X6T6_HYPEX|nr:hypothetical protein BV898_03159 [Hypsibius exemplaris]